MANIHIGTVNVRGLNDPRKRKTFLHWLREKRFEIICLQETFLKEESTQLLVKEWEGKMIINATNSAHSRGCAVLFSKHFNFELINSYVDKDGRRILVNISYANQVYSIVCLYAPNNESHRKDFFNKTNKWINQNALNLNNLSVCGDLNCALESADRMGSSYADSSRCNLKTLMQKLSLQDLFRKKYPQKIMYTYYNKTKTIQSCIDYVLGTAYFLNRIDKIFSLHPPKIPDHKMVVCKLLPDVKIGTGYWKLNVSLLQHDDFKQQISNVIRHTKQQVNEKSNENELWDLCKIKIKEISIKYSYDARCKSKAEICNIEKQIVNIDKEINEEADIKKREKLNIEMKRLKQKLNAYYDTKADGAYVRSRAQWIQEGEKNSRYFLALEQKRQTNNLITKIKCDNGKTVYTTQEILKEAHSFYSSLYSEKDVDIENVHKYLDDINIPYKLTDLDNDILNKDVSEKECYDALLSMGKNKSPGPDGIPAEFYICFWDELKSILVTGYEKSYIDSELSEMQKSSVMPLLFKKMDRFLLKNYRPLTLSNTDYKIIAQVFSKRLQKIISKIISIEQSAYIKGRFIGNNTRFLLDVMNYCDTHGKPGILLFIDFKKAFDSLNWQFIELVLKKFGFQAKFIHWFKTLYKNPISFIKINNTLSQRLKINRGIKQGCSLSALIFIICTEILCLAIKQNSKINGIKIPNNHETRINQYADDTCLFVQDEQSIVHALDCVKKFSNVSGLYLNLDKTEGMAVGSLRNTTVNADPRIKWPINPIRYLGIYVGYNEQICYKKNWTDKLEDMQKLIDNWRIRKLTLYGKVIILKSLIIPKIILSATVLEIPMEVTTSISKMFFNFLWGACDKIKRVSIINPKCNLGLGMIDIESYFLSLKAAWYTRLYGPSNIFKIIPLYHFSKLGGLKLCSNMSFEKLEQASFIKCLPTFWANVLYGFAKARINAPIQSKEELYDQIIWGNISLTVDGQTLHSKTFIDSNILKIGDILHQNGKLKDVFQMMKNKKHYFRVLSLITKGLKQYKYIRFSDNLSHYSNNISYRLNDTQTKSKYFYTRLIAKKAKSLPNLHKWSVHFDYDINCEDVYMHKIKNQPEAKYSEFNFKIFNGILATNSKLFKWKKSDTKSCIYCKCDDHTSQHLLVECSHVSPLWQKLNIYFHDVINWEAVVTGKSLTTIQNTLVTILCYEVYKKFTIARIQNTKQDLINYIITQLRYVKISYSHIASMVTLTQNIKDVIEILQA